MLRIQRHSGWLCARRERPARHHFTLCRVDDRDFALVFDIAVNASGRTIDCGKLGITIERNCSDYACGFGIDHGGRIPAVIENVNLVAKRLVNEGVGICFFDSMLPSDLWLARRALQLAKRLPAQSVMAKSLDLHCPQAKRQRLSRVPEKKPAKEKPAQPLPMAKLGSRPAIS